MKKLLLLSLLAIGATSFAAVEGTAEKAEMPVVVRGSVIDKTGTNLVIEPIKNAGVNGASMEFDFGGIVQGETQALQGTFAIYKANKSVINADMTKMETGFLQADGSVVAEELKTAGADNKVNLAYNVVTTTTSDSKRINGVLDVTAAVAADAGKGSFLDNTVKLAIITKTP